MMSPSSTKKNLKIPISMKSFHRTLKLPTITKNSDAVKTVLRLLIEGEDERNPVLRTVREDQIARNSLFVGPTLTAAIILLSQQQSSAPPLNHIAVILCLLSVSIAVACIFVGLSYRRVRRRLSIALELTGIMLMLLSFFVYLSLYLPACFSWVPMVCFSICLIPLYNAARSIFVRSNPASDDVQDMV